MCIRDRDARAPIQDGNAELHILPLVALEEEVELVVVLSVQECLLLSLIHI